MKLENYLTAEEIADTKGKSLKELQEIVARLTTIPDQTPEDELLNSPSFAKAHMGVIYLYLSNLRMEVHEKKPDSPRIKEIESMIDTSKHCFIGLQTLEERNYKYFDYKAKLIEMQAKSLEQEKKIQELQKINEELINGMD
jgi:hypothetical protein